MGAHSLSDAVPAGMIMAKFVSLLLYINGLAQDCSNSSAL